MSGLIPAERIERKIYFIRGQKVMLSQHLAQLYGVGTKVLLQAVKRNGERFPNDFMFQLTRAEADSLRSQFVTLKSRLKVNAKSSKRGRHSKYLPYAFSEQGVAMLSSVLRSPKAIQVNIAIMRAFVKLREIMSTHKELAEQFKELERKVGTHDVQIRSVFEAIRRLMNEPPGKKRRIGFRP